MSPPAPTSSARRPASSSSSSSSSATQSPQRQHTYQIDPTAPPMLRYQASLPALPVPKLESTISKYLETVQPLLTPSQLATTRSAASEFLSSPFVRTLQTRLEERAERVGDNWLSEWWNDAAYMGYRDPVVVYVSYFYVHKADAKVLQTRNVRRAAEMIKSMLRFREMVESGKLEPDKARGTPLCMDSYKWLFHASRYPKIPSDTAHKFPPESHNHVVVLRKNRFFIVPLVNQTTGKEISAAELELQLERIQRSAGDEPYAVPLGALTSDNRDNWTHAREALLRASGGGTDKNLQNLTKIESAMIVLCLDDTAPVTRDQVSWNTWVGDGRNRWFDKHQLIVYENSRSGFLGEHSCMDGTPTLRMNEFVVASLALGKVDLGPSQVKPEELPRPEELVFDLNDEVKALVKDAEKRFDELVEKHDLHVAHYPAYGSRYIKKHKLSPDAWAQLVKQLAFYKMFGRPGVTYESCQTRKFKKGRTEVIRTVSNEAIEWVRAMIKGGEDPRRLRDLFVRAVGRHMQYATWAADAQGVDRHLFGLKKLIDATRNERTPALYTDDAYGRSSHWELSTSQLSTPWFDGWGYGEVVPDGYGLSYSIGDEYVRWTITSLKRRTEELKHYLEEAATEVRDMMEEAKRLDAAEAAAAPTQKQAKL